jgi:hypothetical protein
MQSSGQYTIIACSADYSEDAEVDFQVQALEGYFIEYYPYLVAAGGWYFNGTTSEWSVVQTIKIGSGEVTVSQSQVTPSPTPNQPTPAAIGTTAATQTPTEIPSQSITQSSPHQPNTQSDVTSGISLEDIALTVACGIIAVLAVALVLSRRKRA